MTSMGVALNNLVDARHNHGVRQPPTEQNGGIGDIIYRISPIALGLIAAVGASIAVGILPGLLIGVGSALATFLITRGGASLWDICQHSRSRSNFLEQPANINTRQFQPNMAPSGRSRNVVPGDGHVPPPVHQGPNVMPRDEAPRHQHMHGPGAPPHVLPGQGHVQQAGVIPQPGHQGPNVMPRNEAPRHQHMPGPGAPPHVPPGRGHGPQAGVIPAPGQNIPPGRGHQGGPIPQRGAQAPGGNVPVGRNRV